MTTPQINLEEIVPSKWKTWIALVGTILSFGGPFILENSQLLPSPWPVIVGLFFAAATTLGVYKGKYKPEGTTLAVDPNAAVVSSKVPENAPVAVQPSAVVTENTDVVNPTATRPEIPRPDNGYTNPWR